MLEQKRTTSIPPYVAALLIPLAWGLIQEVSAQNNALSTSQYTPATHIFTRSPITQLQGKIRPHLQFIIKGNVSDQLGNVITGATIDVKNTYRATRSDFDGNFCIVASQGETLIFSSVG